MTSETMTASYDGVQLYLRKDLPENMRAVALVVHGLCEHQGRYDYLSEKLNAAGIGVYRFDHRGHGRSEGKRVYYKNFREIAEDVHMMAMQIEAESPDYPIFVIGHSMGGYASALFASLYPGVARGVVLSGALTRGNQRLALPEGLDPDVYLPNELAGGVCSDPDVVAAYKADPYVEKQISVALFNSMMKGVEWLTEHPGECTDPMLILHGANDGLVSEKDSRDFFGEIASADKSLRIYAFLLHEIFNEPSRDEVIADVLRWIEQRIA